MNISSLRGTDAEAIGVRLGQLSIVSHIGDGGMGTVYRAEHIVLKTAFAVKVLHRRLLDSSNIERFRREALVCCKLNHPNVVFVSDFGAHKDIGVFIVMELLEGVTLEAYLQAKERLGVWRMVHIAEQLCEGISAAHAMDLIHRDMKPENVYLVPRSAGRHQVKILDFGIVRLKQDHHQLTQAGAALGTPVYMAPEQIRGCKEIDHSADLYSMGAIFYEMLAGVPPFQDDQQLNILRMHMTEDAAPISSHRPELKGTCLERLIHDMLSKEPSARPTSALVVLDKLDEALVELQDRGLSTAFPESNRGSRTSLQGVGGGSADRIIAAYMAQIAAQLGDSALGGALARVPQLDELAPDIFFEMVWGVLVRSALDAPFPSESFEDAAKGLALTIALLLSCAGRSNSPAPLVSLLERSLNDLFKVLPVDRQKVLCTDLQPLFVEQYFPVAALPDWLLSPEVSAESPRTRRVTTGTFAAIRSLLTFGSGRKPS